MYSNVAALLLTLVICLKSNVKLIIEIWLKTVHFNSKKKCFKYRSFDLSLRQPQRADFAYLAQQLFSGIVQACRQAC